MYYCDYTAGRPELNGIGPLEDGTILLMEEVTRNEVVYNIYSLCPLLGKEMMLARQNVHIHPHTSYSQQPLLLLPSANIPLFTVNNAHSPLYRMVFPIQDSPRHRSTAMGTLVQHVSTHST